MTKHREDSQIGIIRKIGYLCFLATNPKKWGSRVVENMRRGHTCIAVSPWNNGGHDAACFAREKKVAGFKHAIYDNLLKVISSFAFSGANYFISFHLLNNMQSLEGMVGGLPIRNPVMLASGILGSSGGSLRRASQAGAGCVVTKSVGTRPRDGHTGPTVVQVNCGLLNAMGLPNPGYKEFQEEIDIARMGGVPVVASIFGADKEEFIEIASFIKADAFELNLSCPHAKCYGADLGIYPDLVEMVTRSVKNKVNVPVWVKLTPNTSDIVELGIAAQSGGADAVVAINTLKAMAIDIEMGSPILGNTFGGLSGPAIKPVALRCVYDLSLNLDIPVIGVGGISTWEDAVEMIMAGAQGVQIGTALYKGYEVFQDIINGLLCYLERKSITLEQLKGCAWRQV